MLWQYERNRVNYGVCFGGGKFVGPTFLIRYSVSKYYIVWKVVVRHPILFQVCQTKIEFEPNGYQIYKQCTVAFSCYMNQIINKNQCTEEVSVCSFETFTTENISPAVGFNWFTIKLPNYRTSFLLFQNKSFPPIRRIFTYPFFLINSID